MRRIFYLWVTVLTAVTFFIQPNILLANEFDPAGPYKVYGPQTDDRYLYFGDDANCEYEPCRSRHESNGLSVTVDPESISHQSIRAIVTMDLELINHRNITEFEILLNGNRIVDGFNAYWDNWTEENRRYYAVTVTAGTQYTGARMYFQVVGLSDNGQGEKYVVAWSNYTPTYEFKPFPTIDRDAISVLEAIYRKLDELLSTMSEKLDTLNDSIREIYEIDPQTKQKFDNALANLQSKLPTEQIKNQANQIQNIVENSANIIENTEQKVEFGEFDWMGTVTTPILDFSGMMNHVDALRKILQITLWLEFFYGVILVLRPRLTV